jgi:hypothetical protein
MIWAKVERTMKEDLFSLGFSIFVKMADKD